MGRSVPTICEACPHKSCLKTGKPCDAVESLLPSPTKGRGRRENLTGLYESWLIPASRFPGRLPGSARYWLPEDIADERARDLLRGAEDIWHGLTYVQQEAAWLVWGLGLSQSRAARKIGVVPSTVSRAISMIHKKLARKHATNVAIIEEDYP